MVGPAEAEPAPSEPEDVEDLNVYLVCGECGTELKVSRLGGRVVTVTPEFAEVARIAREKSLAAREVLEQARADGRRHFHE